jgi:hypothetical protein
MDKSKLEEYVKKGLSSYKIAEIENVSVSKVNLNLRNYKLVTLTNVKLVHDKYKCEDCLKMNSFTQVKNGLCESCKTKYSEIIKEKNAINHKFACKRCNASKEGIYFKLTLEEYIALSKEANITSTDIKPNGYHLSRFNDSGAYEVGNCRFLFHKENIKERKISDKNRQASKENISKFNKTETKEKRVLRIDNANRERKKWWDSLSEEEKKDRLGYLDEKEIKRRHDIIRKIPDKFGRLTIASKLIGIKPQVVGRFLKKYPIKD